MSSNTVTPTREHLVLYGNAVSGSRWFYWIAGLSVVNSVLMLTNADLQMVVGLGITQVVAALAVSLGSPTVAVAVAMVATIAVAGIFALMGFLGGTKGAVWAFVLGMVLYALDTPVFILFEDWLPVAFHAFALFSMWKGLQALLTLRKAGVDFVTLPLAYAAATSAQAPAVEAAEAGAPAENVDSAEDVA